MKDNSSLPVPDPEYNARISKEVLGKMFPKVEATATQTLMLRVKNAVMTVKKRGELLIHAKKLVAPFPPSELDKFREFIIDQFCSEFNTLSKDELVILCAIIHMSQMTQDLDGFQVP